jgi:hypothetical protein
MTKICLFPITLATAFACGLVGAGCAGGNTTSVDLPRIDRLSVYLHTPEQEDGARHILVVGLEGGVSVWGERNGLGVQPRHVEFESTAPDVLAVSGTGPSRHIRGVRPGTATVIARGEGLTAWSKPVQVEASPPPLTSLKIGLYPLSAGTGAQYDNEGSLVFVSLRVDDMLLPEPRAFRNAARVFFTHDFGANAWSVPFSVSTSDPGVAQLCDRSSSVAYCQHPSMSDWGGIVGMRQGDATITFAVRNLSRSFTVRVEQP